MGLLKKLLGGALGVALALMTTNSSAQPIQTNQLGFDWLLTPEKSQAYIRTSADGKELTIGNAMVSRTFRLSPNLSTISLKNLMTGEEMIRAASPEGSLTIDGKEYPVGGLTNQPELAFLKYDWLDKMSPLENTFLLKDYSEGIIEEKIQWVRKRWALNKQAPTGKTVTFVLEGQDGAKGITLRITFSAYDHIPVISKQMEVINHSNKEICLDAFRLEHLSFAEPDGPFADDAPWSLHSKIHIESDYNCAGQFTHRGTDRTTHWVMDTSFTSQREYNCTTQCMLDVNPTIGPAQRIDVGATFQTFTVWEMLFDTFDHERQGLFQRRFYRTVAPWVTENPIFVHLTSNEPSTVRSMVDQCAETGYEMVILSFGCGLNAEDVSDENISRYKELVDYAHSKGIEMGCYSLLASRHIDNENDCLNSQTGKPGGMIFGYSPCLCSSWGQVYFSNIEKFISETGMDCLEHDGSYPGDFCASENHPGHRGLNDSQWNQFYTIANFYHRMCERGVYLNVPDFYFLNGSTKTGIGYKEVNWSLPREMQLLHTRQLNYDCTFERPQSACWSFVPLTQYHSGGEAATIEPLSEHLFEYKTLMFQNYASGVQACYRGPRLYDTEETKQTVIDIISWYKKYRSILNSDIIHLRKPDARDWDGILHVNPTEKEKGLAIFYNPLNAPITRTITLPLYYTGLEQTARIREQEGKSKTYHLNRDYTVQLTITIPANGYTWYVIE